MDSAECDNILFTNTESDIGYLISAKKVNPVIPPLVLAYRVLGWGQFEGLLRSHPIKFGCYQGLGPKGHTVSIQISRARVKI